MKKLHPFETIANETSFANMNIATNESFESVVNKTHNKRINTRRVSLENQDGEGSSRATPIHDRRQSRLYSPIVEGIPPPLL